VKLYVTGRRKLRSIRFDEGLVSLTKFFDVGRGGSLGCSYCCAYF
jgi:hypothetical protein